MSITNNNESYLSFFIDLTDEMAEIIPESPMGYFDFISTVLNPQPFITYSPVVYNEDLYFKAIIDSIKDAEHAEIILESLSLIKGGKVSSKDTYNGSGFSSSEISQITINYLNEAKEYDFLCHDFERLLLHPRRDIPNGLNYGNYFSDIIKKDIDYFTNNVESIYNSYLFSDQIIRSPRFNVTTLVRDPSLIMIDEIGLSPRAKNALKWAKINTVKEFLALTDEEISGIKLLSSTNRKEIKDIKGHIINIHDSCTDYSIDDLNIRSFILMYLIGQGIATYSDLKNMSMEQLMKFRERDRLYLLTKMKEIDTYVEFRLPIPTYELDPTSIFQRKERPITKTDLPVDELIRLLQHGVFFLEDYLFYNNLFFPLENEILHNYATNVLLTYSSPMVRIQIPQRTLHVLEKEGMTTFHQIKKMSESYNGSEKENIRKIVNDVLSAIEYYRKDFN